MKLLKNWNYNFILILGIMIFFSRMISAQNDTLVFSENDKIIGELKSMDRGVAKFETAYSENDFEIEWSGVKGVYTESIYLISVANGINFIGKIKSVSEDKVYILENDGDIVPWKKDRIVYLTSIDKGFWDRLSASIDVGFSLTKANNLRQLNIRSSLGYKSDMWSLDGAFNTNLSTQNDAEDIRRTEGDVNYKYIMVRNWYGMATISLLKNTEQKLDLRTNTQLGLGHFLFRSNAALWGLNIGINRNFENYSNDADNRNSYEGYLGTDLDLFDMGDLSLLFSAMTYAGITEKGRWRADLKLDFKFDLPYDLYIKLGASYNYDNRPAEGASMNDYVLQNGFGWEW